MLEGLWLVPVVPLAGFLLLAAASLPRRAVAAVGVGSVAVAAVLAGLASVDVARRGLLVRDRGYSQVLWTWMELGDPAASLGLHLDALSMVMMLIVTGVGVLIHLYAAQYMADDAGYQRFFAYMNLFVAAMLVLVLADNFLLLFVGWEGVGLCSYLLIGHWYEDPDNGRAARKAFIVNRLGDTAFLLGLFVIITHLGTAQIQEAMRRAAEQWAVGSGLAVAAAALLLGGAVGKSAQVPLQVWLPDAMAGPTPVSALIHAATMVTAGVYLIARTHVLYGLAPAVQLAVGVLGAVTLLLAALSALAQRDIKRVLAFSTISQLGYMFLALGVGAGSAAVFHLTTHAFFKALLFLAAGAVILSLHHERDLFRMGGLRRDLPVAFWTMLIGAASLAGVPFVTAGFFSKELILWEAWRAPVGGVWLWAAGLLGVFLTAQYAFRLVFLVFLGEQRRRPDRGPGWAMTASLVLLAALSVGGGWVETPEYLGHVTLFTSVLQTAVPVHNPEPGLAPHAHERLLQVIVSATALAGIVVAWLLYARPPAVVQQAAETAPVQEVKGLARRGWAFNWVYDRLFVRPFVLAARAGRPDVFDRTYDRLLVQPYNWLANLNRDDLVDQAYDMLVRGGERAHELVHRTQTGQLRWYATVLVAGSLVLIGITVFL